MSVPRAHPEDLRVGPSHWGLAWVALTAAFALHVLDEASNNFLAVYNPAAQNLRQRWPFLPLPSLTFEGWLTALVIALLVLLMLSPLAFRRARWLRPLSWLYGVAMLANGMGHLVGSFYLGRPMPGASSAPLLLLCASYLVWALARSPNQDS